MSLAFVLRRPTWKRALAAAVTLACASAHADFLRWAGHELAGAAAKKMAEHQQGEAAQLPQGPGFAGCRHFFPGARVPAVSTALPGRQRELCFDSFAVLHSGQSRTPVYVVERLNRAQLLDARDEARTDRFFSDARLPSSERATLEDYSNPGGPQRWDRGHLAPAGDMPDARSMAQSFSLANIVPQAPHNNRFTWKNGVEIPVRKYVMRAAGDVYVFTGPVFGTLPPLTIGAGQVWVPTHLFKLVYDPSAQKAWAYWLENTDGARMTAPIPYEELKRRTGIDFLGSIKVD